MDCFSFVFSNDKPEFKINGGFPFTGSKKAAGYLRGDWLTANDNFQLRSASSRLMAVQRARIAMAMRPAADLNRHDGESQIQAPSLQTEPLDSPPSLAVERWSPGYWTFFDGEETMKSLLLVEGSPVEAKNDPM